MNELTQLPSLWYHRKCYQYFTMKSALDRIEQQRAKQTVSLSSTLGRIGEFCDS